MSETIHTHITRGGRLVIPASLRHRLSLEDGTPVVITVEGDGVRVIPFAAAIREAQDLLAKFLPPDADLQGDLRELRSEWDGRNG